MKTHLTKILAGVMLFGLVAVNSCTGDFEDMNKPHNLLLDDKVSIDMLFTNVLVAVRNGSQIGRGLTGNYSGMSVAGDNFPFQDGQNAGVFNSTYSNGRNLGDIIRLCQKRDAENGNNNNVNKQAIARIVKAWLFARGTNTYGNIPYFEACLPIEDAVYTPKYDTQKEIYTDLLKELKEAAAQLTTGVASYGNADVLYKGDIEKWRKLANSLRLRLALRLRYVDPEMAKANMSDLTEAVLITENSGNAITKSNMQHTDFYNPGYSDLANRGVQTTKMLAAKTLLDILNDNDDPRTKIYCDTAKATFRSFGYRGRPLLGRAPVQQGYPYAQESVSRISDLFFVQVLDQVLYKASETYFSLAEAALFGLLGSASNAQTYYRKGLEVEMAYTLNFFKDCEPQLPTVIRLFRPSSTTESINREIDDKRITQDEIDYFLENASVVTLSGTDEEKLEQIINQKLFSYFHEENEAWFEHIRTGYPRILIGADTDDLRGQIPRRMPWPTSEQLYNLDQYNKALEAIGGAGKDNRLTRNWYDANPNPIKKHPGEVEWMEQPY